MIKLNTVETILDQAIKANVKEFRESKKEYYYWNAKVNECERGSKDYLKYTIFADQHFYEYMTIKHTLIRLFPDYEEKIIDGLYGNS